MNQPSIRFVAKEDDTKAALVVPVFGSELIEDTFGLSNEWIQLARISIEQTRFRGDTNRFHDIQLPEQAPFSALILAGFGPKDDPKRESSSFENWGGHLFAFVDRTGRKRLRLRLGSMDLKPQELARIGEGLLLRSWRNDLRTSHKPEEALVLEDVAIESDQINAAEAAMVPRQAIVDAVYFARQLVTDPPNILFPASFAERLEGLQKFGVDVEVLGPQQLERENMRTLLGVAQGSARGAHVVVMRYMGGKPSEAPVALVGKGVTFDTGGISIKPAANMHEMKWDMGGAAAVAGTVQAAASAGMPVNLIGIVGLVENMPSSKAQRPGDVVTSRSGKTVEILNTDAEGRLVLCDLLDYVIEKYQPARVIDLATLTMAIIISLGRGHAGLFSNDDLLAKQLKQAGQDSGEQVWRLPLGEIYDKQLRSPIADMKNIGDRSAGAIVAAQFLQRFVGKTPWAHLDIAGMAWADEAGPLHGKGATGFGVRLLIKLLGAGR